MLGNSQVVAIVPTTDLARARAFYVDTLGLTDLPIPVEDADESLVLRSGDSLLYVYERPSAPTANHTLASWMVDDLDGVVDGLLAKGISLETYPDLPGVTWDARGVAESAGGVRSAWFRDPDGNVLAVNQAIDLP